MFERKCPFEINLIDPEVLQRVGHEISEQEELVVKILVKVSKFSLNKIRGQNKTTARLKLSSSVKMTTSSSISTLATSSRFLN